jgi:choline kinase
VSGVSILERLLRALSSYDFTRLVVVVGHRSDAIQDYLGDHSGDIRISYIFSPSYRTTNNIYSLWLARRAIDEPFVLIESDLVFEESLLEEMLRPDRAAISRQLPWMNGTERQLAGRLQDPRAHPATTLQRSPSRCAFLRLFTVFAALTAYLCVS